MRLAICASVLLLAACATPYQASGFRGGYSETRVADNVAEIHFSGNANTSSAFVRNAALLRAAEYTLDNGYEWFEVGRINSASSRRPTIDPGQPMPAYGSNQVAWPSNPSVSTTQKHRTDLYIYMGDYPAPSEATPLDAAEVAEHLRAELK